MGPTSRLIFGVAGAFFCIGIVYAIAAARLSVSLQKGTYRFRASLCAGAAILLGALVALVYEATLPTFDVVGTIETARVQSENRSYRTYLKLRDSSGAEIAVNASGRSAYFHPGQTAEVRYQGVSGHVLHARFLSVAGAQEAVFNGTDTWPPYWGLAVGAFVIVAGIRRRRSDPEGAASRF